jgi:hypothetical protein
MRIAELGRYPVKSMRGEQLYDTVLTDDGVPGDRVAHVYGPRGVLTARTRHRLLWLAGTLGADGEPLIDGRPWHHPTSAAAVREAAGAQAIAALGEDGRRLRPNIVLSGVLPSPPLAAGVPVRRHAQAGAGCATCPVRDVQAVPLSILPSPRGQGPP